MSIWDLDDNAFNPGGLSNEEFENMKREIDNSSYEEILEKGTFENNFNKIMKNDIAKADYELKNTINYLEHCRESIGRRTLLQAMNEIQKYRESKK